MLWQLSFPRVLKTKRHLKRKKYLRRNQRKLAFQSQSLQMMLKMRNKKSKM